MKLSLISLTALLVYLAIVITPLGIALHLSLPQRPLFDQLSSGLAMIGFNIILLEFVTTGRIRVLSRLLGIDWILQIHQLFARTAVVFLTIHPFIYTLPSRATYAAGAPDENYLGLLGPSFISGVIGVLILAALIGMAITRSSSQMKYETWRISHALMAVLIALLGFHHTTHAGRYAQEPAMLMYWKVGLAISLLSLAWVYIIRPLMQKLDAYEVISIKEIAHKIYELTIRSKNKKQLNYQAGQFAWIKLKTIQPPFENPFSISSSPQLTEAPGEIKFLIKDIGDFTHQVSELKVGELIYIDAPYGNFGQSCLDSSRKHIVMIAGGAGIAPIISLLRTLAARSKSDLADKKIQIIYGNRIKEQIIDLNKMIDFTKFKNLNLIPVVTEASSDWSGMSGLLDEPALRTLLHPGKNNEFPLAEAQFLVCGPAEMIDSVEITLGKMGISLTQIDSEKFQYDFSQGGPRNRLSLLILGLASSALVLSALYLSRL